MFRRVKDFTASWEHEAASTLKLLRNLTDDSLGQSIVEGGRSLGFLGWHLTTSVTTMAGLVGIEVDGPPIGTPAPSRAGEIVAQYEAVSRTVAERAKEGLTEDSLSEIVPFFGNPLPRGVALSVIILHQAHHRGQMTVLMRQAGLVVPGVYGPAREEWTAMGQAAPA